MRRSLGFCLFVGSHRIRAWDCRDKQIRFVGEFSNEDFEYASLFEGQQLENHQKISIFLDSDRVLFANIQLSHTSRSNPQAAIYEAETYFPFPAEEVIFINDVDAAGRGSFFVIEKDWYEKFCRGLTQKGGEVLCAVSSTPVLALSAVDPIVPSSYSVAIRRMSLIENLIVNDFRLQSWTCESRTDSPGNFETGSFGSLEASPDQATVENVLRLEFDSMESYEQAVLDSYGRLLPLLTRRGIKLEFPVLTDNLNELNQNRWQFVGLFAFVVLLILSAICWSRSRQYQRYAEHAEDKLVQLTKTHFPEQRIGSPKRAFEGELQVLQRQLQSWQTITKREAVIRSLLVFLQNVPKVPTIDFKLLDFQPGIILIEGTADKLDDVSELAEQFRQAGLRVNETKYGLQFALEIIVTTEMLQPPVEVEELSALVERYALTKISSK